MADGEFVRLAEQDRRPLGSRAIAEGQELLRSACAQPARARIRCRPRSTPCTATRATAAQTDWRQIVALYDQLLALAPKPVVALNRAVAVAEVEAGTGFATRRTRST